MAATLTILDLVIAITAIAAILGCGASLNR